MIPQNAARRVIFSPYSQSSNPVKITPQNPRRSPAPERSVPDSEIPQNFVARAAFGGIKDGSPSRFPHAPHALDQRYVPGKLGTYSIHHFLHEN